MKSLPNQQIKYRVIELISIMIYVHDHNDGDAWLWKRDKDDEFRIDIDGLAVRALDFHHLTWLGRKVNMFVWCFVPSHATRMFCICFFPLQI